MCAGFLTGRGKRGEVVLLGCYVQGWVIIMYKWVLQEIMSS